MQHYRDMAARHFMLTRGYPRGREALPAVGEICSAGSAGLGTGG